MKELQRKQKIRRAIYSIPSLIILSLVAVLLAKGAIGVIGKERESARRVKELEEKVDALAIRELELKENVIRLGTEEGVKDEIRGKFSVILEGEHVAVIVDEKRSATSTDISVSPWYKRFFNVLKNLW